MKTFIALDGEAVRDRAGRDVYCLLAASTGESLWDSQGISTADALDFLHRVGADRKRNVLVGFGLNYDINRILKDVDVEALRCLKADKSAQIAASGRIWRITWTVSKSLVITPKEVVRKDGRIRGWRWGTAVRVSDVWGFFQTGFLKACLNYNVITPREAAFVESMKAARSRFRADMASRLTAYNALECDLLVRLMNEYRRLATEEDVLPERWEGAGSAAAAVMKRHGVRDAVPPSLEARWTPNLRRAYFGGRIQVLRVGLVNRPAWNYDVNAAYPAEMVALPSLHGRWRAAKRYDPMAPWAMWQVRWDVSERGAEVPFTPFPFRLLRGTIVYPSKGQGVYWSPLVKAALRGWPNGITVERGWIWEPSDPNARPFAYLADFYRRRLKYKLATPPDPRGNVIKTPLNAHAGKTMQTVGWRDRPPPYMSFLWAGLVTAGCQARLLDAALHAPESVLLFSTDGLYSTRKLPLPVSGALGEWEAVKRDGMLILKPGLYGVFNGGRLHKRTRGWGAHELEDVDLLGAWLHHGPQGELSVATERFVGLRSALHSSLSPHWNTWVSQETTFRTRPGTGYPELWKPGLRSCRWITSYGLGCTGGVLSEPYEPKHIRLDPSQRIEDLELALLEEHPDLLGLPD